MPVSGSVSIGAVTSASITSDSALSIKSSTGQIKVGGYTFPTNTPSANTVLVSDGSGNLSFQSTNQRADVTTATYTILPEDDIIAITVEQNTVLTLPPPSSRTVGDIIYVVKEVGGTSTVTINPNGTELISGNTSYVFSSAYGANKVYTNGTNWFLLF